MGEYVDLSPPMVRSLTLSQISIFISNAFTTLVFVFHFQSAENCFVLLNFRDAVTKYGSGLDLVSRQLLEVLAEGLGLPTEKFAEHVDGKKALLRWILYPACPRPTDIIGNAKHTDPFALTVLLSDKVGGLQIEKDGEWVGVKPIEGALTVNIGDTLHVSAFPWRLCVL